MPQGIEKIVEMPKVISKKKIESNGNLEKKQDEVGMPEVTSQVKTAATEAAAALAAEEIMTELAPVPPFPNLERTTVMDKAAAMEEEMDSLEDERVEKTSEVPQEIAKIVEMPEVVSKSVGARTVATSGAEWAKQAVEVPQAAEKIPEVPSEDEKCLEELSNKHAKFVKDSMLSLALRGWRIEAAWAAEQRVQQDAKDFRKEVKQ